MVELTQAVLRTVESPPLVPAERPIDVGHLARMTWGDRALEREVLGLFCRQAELLRERMPLSDARVAGASAHTLKGSARGIGAWAVAEAAEAVEISSQDAHDNQPEALARLDVAVAAARAEIGELIESDHA